MGRCCLRGGVWVAAKHQCKQQQPNLSALVGVCARVLADALLAPAVLLLALLRRPCVCVPLPLPLPVSALQAIARQLLVAVAYIHELGLVHTDLKPENILMAAQDHMKLPPVPPAA